jgi:hypothetical protein
MYGGQCHNQATVRTSLRCCAEEPDVVVVCICVGRLIEPFVVECSRLTLMLRDREVPGSNIGPETGYPD